jgi:hypothetical protein
MSSPPCSGRASPSTLPMRSESPRSVKSSTSARPSRLVVGGCGGPSSRAGPSGCYATCAPSSQKNAMSSPPRPTKLEGSYIKTQSSQPVQLEPTPIAASSPPSKPILSRLSTATLHRHLSIASSTSVLPFSNKRRPSIPLEDFPQSPSDDEWEDFSFEQDIAPVSPTRNVVRRKPSVPLSPRLTKGASECSNYFRFGCKLTRFNCFACMQA